METEAEGRKDREVEAENGISGKVVIEMRAAM